MKSFVFSLLFLFSFTSSCQSEPRTAQQEAGEQSEVLLKEEVATTSEQAAETPTAAVAEEEKAERVSEVQYHSPSEAPTTPTVEKTTSGAVKREAQHPEKPAAKEARPVAQTPPPLVEEDEVDEGLSHQLWDDLLRSYVSAEGRVDYAGMRSEKAKLDKYLAQLKAYPPQSDWTKEEQMAYWINAYNAFTVKLILDHYPVKSIRDIHKGDPWNVKWIEIGKKIYSLNEIENEMLRARFRDARIHFAVNCAARSCPPLYNRAWEASTLSQTLDARARAFINNPRYNQISPSEAKVSKIFDWYAADFGDLRAFLNRYTRTQLQAGASIDFLEYDWALNGK